MSLLPTLTVNLLHPKNSLLCLMHKYARTAAKTIGFVLDACAVVLLCPCFCGVFLLRGPRKRRTCVIRSYPGLRRSRPKTRIDLQRLAPAEQPQNCFLLKLPLEVRQHIYEHALGGRVLHVQFVGPKVRSTCYQLVDHPSVNPQRLDERTDSILTPLLRSCRQVYLEAQPILLQRNTLYFSVLQLQIAILEGIGMHSLPDIRSIYLYHNYRTSVFVPPWHAVFPLLQQMHLTHLVFHFELETLFANIGSWAGSRVDILEQTWLPRVLSIRNLNQFGLFFEDGGAPEKSLCRENIAEGMRQLMLGTQADEKYMKFLQTWNANRS
ncbi:hypothetical protein MSAN_01247200 [Mycena sanguinolenta]|uniref:DUF7730 domain-containing protein n=1 Tax=Mycena sanguinolenta TaxID=230812 RepID=A0A8H6YIA2_9AGAR|nr:hypothetical protein MSAN_01247200 [Mycena sanguinolenta]